MRKLIVLAATAFFVLISYTQDLTSESETKIKADTITNQSGYTITEANIVFPYMDSSINMDYLHNYLLMTYSAANSDSSIFGITKKSTEDKTLFIGKYIKEDSKYEHLKAANKGDFYTLSYLSNLTYKRKGDAILYKEYVEGSFEKHAKKYYFFRLVFEKEEWQIYGYEIEYNNDPL